MVSSIFSEILASMDSVTSPFYIERQLKVCDE